MSAQSPRQAAGQLQLCDPDGEVTAELSASSETSPQERSGLRDERTSVPGVYRRGRRYSVIYRDPQGRQRRRSARTLAEARVLKAALTADVARGDYRALSAVRFADYARHWITSYPGRTRRGFRETTREEYRRDLEREAIPFFGRMKLTEIEPQDVKRYTAELGQRGLSHASVRNALAPVRALLATALEEGLLRSNPAAGIRIASAPSPDAEEEHAKALSEEELARLLAATAPPWRLLLEFLAHTGLRISEALALIWSDIDPDTHHVRIRRRLYRGIDAPKSRYARRDVPLSPAMLTRLQTLRAGSNFPADSDPVFASERGTALSYANLYHRVLKPAATRADLPWIGFHTLRHTCATRLFRAGLNPKQVQLWLGHHSSSFTLDTYVHLLPGDLPEATFLDRLAAASAGNRAVTGPAETGRDSPLAAKPEDAQ